MAQGKYEQRGQGNRRRRRRRMNPTFPIFVLIVLVLVAGIAALVLRACDGRLPDETQPSESLSATDPSASKPTQPSIVITDPTDQTTEPTEQTTEPTTEPTEQTTEPTTEPTEETTEPTEETTEPSTAPTEPLTPAELGEEVARIAQEQVGKAYRMGGTGPDDFDTTGLVYFCHRQAGIEAPRLLSQQATFGVEVTDPEDLLPGDVVFFWTDAPGSIDYPAIYIGGGQCVGAFRTDVPVDTFGLNERYYAEHYVTARRFG